MFRENDNNIPKRHKIFLRYEENYTKCDIIECQLLKRMRKVCKNGIHVSWGPRLRGKTKQVYFLLLVKGLCEIIYCPKLNSFDYKLLKQRSSFDTHNVKKSRNNPRKEYSFFTERWNLVSKQKAKNLIWSRKSYLFFLNILPSFLMPIFKHFFSRQCWHWFLWCWSTLQFLLPRHWYVKLRRTERLKKLLQPTQCNNRMKQKVIKSYKRFDLVSWNC